MISVRNNIKVRWNTQQGRHWQYPGEPELGGLWTFFRQGCESSLNSGRCIWSRESDGRRRFSESGSDPHMLAVARLITGNETGELVLAQGAPAPLTGRCPQLQLTVAAEGCGARTTPTSVDCVKRSQTSGFKVESLNF